MFKFTYFSITIMTTTGYGDVLSPRGAFAQACVCAELLCSAFYLQIILALGVSLIVEDQQKAAAKRQNNNIGPSAATIT